MDGNSDQKPDNDGREQLPQTALTATSTVVWPTPDRDSPQLGSFTGGYDPEEKIGAFLKMDGLPGRSDEDIKKTTGIDITRARRLHKLFERMAILHPGEGNTRLARLGRILRDAIGGNGAKTVIAREALSASMRYQLANPEESEIPVDCDIHPYWAVLRAAAALDWRIHWDEVNRELMRLTRDDQVDDAIARIKAARADPKYATFIGGPSNDAGLLAARSHPADATAPVGKTPVGQLRDQKMTPFLKRVGFGELYLASPGKGGEGYWTVPPEFHQMILEAVAKPQPARRFATKGDWINWYYEGAEPARTATPPPSQQQPHAVVPVRTLTIKELREALNKYEPDLTFSDHLLAKIVGAIRAGDNKTFIILRGVSGTGKSRLVSAIARAVYAAAKVDRPYLSFIEVRPEWTESADLLGHYDPVQSRYMPTRFFDALVTAHKVEVSKLGETVPVFVCLDEMNLARVEYYLADCLSAMESGLPMAFALPEDVNATEEITWPRNLFLFGTINTDESTLRLTDKVLDRAQVIDTSDIDLLPQFEKWLSQSDALNESERARVLEIVGATWQALKTIGHHFGFRTGRAIVRFINETKSSSDGALSIDDMIDIQLEQKVLPKLKGQGDKWRKPLEDLEAIFGKLSGVRQSQAIVRAMRDDLATNGSFKSWN